MHPPPGAFHSKEYSYQNDFLPDQSDIIQDTKVSQHFIARGNIISNISLYLLNNGSKTISIELQGTDGHIIKTSNVDIPETAANSWEKFAFDCRIERGKEYVLEIGSDNGLNSLLIDTGERPEIFTSCSVGQESIDGCVAVGINQTYQYLTLAGSLELVFAMIMVIMLAAMLCYAVFNIEDLIRTFKETEEKRGVLFAIYFAVTLMFLFNPIDPLRTEVLSFGRVIGAGLNANVDVSRRIGNFNNWFVYFAVSFSLLFLLVNHLKKKELSVEKKKVSDFLDQFVVLADVNLLLRCITYFADRKNMQTMFNYSTSVCALIRAY